MYGFFDRKLKDKKLLWLLIPVLTVLALWWYAGQVADEMQAAKFRERCAAVDRSLNLYTADMLQDEITLDRDFNTYDYASIVGAAMARIDKEPMTFAAAYREVREGDTAIYPVVTAQDGTVYEVISERTESLPGTMYNPLVYASFLTAIETHDQGHLFEYFKPKGAEPREMFNGYRWIPNRGDEDRPFLLVVAVSKYSVTASDSEQLLIWGIIGFGGVTCILNFILLGYILHIIHRREQTLNGINNQ